MDPAAHRILTDALLFCFVGRGHDRQAEQKSAPTPRSWLYFQLMKHCSVNMQVVQLPSFFFFQFCFV